MNQLKVCNKQYFLSVKLLYLCGYKDSIEIRKQSWFLPLVCFSSAYKGKKNLFIFHKWKIKILIKVLVPFIVNVLTNITSVWLVVCPCMFLHFIYIFYACLHKHGLIQKWVKKREIPFHVSTQEEEAFLKGLWNSYSKLKSHCLFSGERCLVP